MHARVHSFALKSHRNTAVRVLMPQDRVGTEFCACVRACVCVCVCAVLHEILSYKRIFASVYRHAGDMLCCNSVMLSAYACLQTVVCGTIYMYRDNTVCEIKYTTLRS